MYVMLYGLFMNKYIFNLFKSFSGKEIQRRMLLMSIVTNCYKTPIRKIQIDLLGFRRGSAGNSACLIMFYGVSEILNRIL